jgi:pimeloyl-ACP methyl ester carboxylesterase
VTAGATTGLWVVEEGDPSGSTVVLVHGSMDRSTSFAKAARRLPDLRVLRYDRRGYGRSVGVPPAADVAVHVDDLLALVGGGPAVVVGHSIGGVIALAAAERRSGAVAAVGAFEAPMPWEPWWPSVTAGGSALAGAEGDPHGAAEVFMRRMIGDDRWERLPERTRHDRRAEGPALLADLHMVRSGRPPYSAAGLTVPVVVGHGTESRAHHREAAARLAAAVPGAELVVVEGAGHGAHSSHPEAFAAFVRRVLGRADGRAG